MKPVEVENRNSSPPAKLTLVVLAAGMGSRYGGLKQLDGVGPGGETIIEYSVHDAIRAGFDKVVFVVQESFATEFQQQVCSAFSGLIEVEMVYQPLQPEIEGLGVVARKKPWGTGHALLAARDVVDGPFAVLNADDFYGLSSFQLMARFLAESVSPTRYAMVGFKLSNTLSENGSVSRGVCETDTRNRLTAVVERTKINDTGNGVFDMAEDPPVELSIEDWVSMNFWGFDVAFFEELESHFVAFARAQKGNPVAEFYIPLIVNDLIEARQIEVNLLESAEQWYGVTYAQDKAGVQHAIRELIDQKRYADPLWSNPL